MERIMNGASCERFLIADAIDSAKHHVEVVEFNYRYSEEEEKYVSPSKEGLEKIQEALAQVDELELLFKASVDTYIMLKRKRDRIRRAVLAWVRKNKK